MGIEVAQAYQNRKYQTTDKLTQKVISKFKIDDKNLKIK